MLLLSSVNKWDIDIRLNGKKFSYDDDGNQVQAGDTSFDYMTSHVNGNNVKRLKSVYENTDHVASYSYTFEGLRTGRYLNEGKSEVSFHYSGKNVIYERWSNGRTVRYTHPSSTSGCSSCGGCGNKGNVFTDHPISIEINGSKYYYLYNGQGSVTELINSDEDVVNQYRYTPFGSPRLKVESVYNPYQYTGRRMDEETGQYYYRARMYSAQQCRFTTQDPAGMTEGSNMYAYVGNIIGTTVPMSVGNRSDFLLNPTNKRDPTGLVAPMADIDRGGSGGDGETCPDTTFYSSWDQCMNERDNFDERADLCFGDGGDVSSGGLPSFTIDDEEYEQCLQDEIVDISSSEAACMVGSTGGAAVATVAIALVGTATPEPAISKATAGAASATAITYFALGVVGDCIGGSLVSNYDDAINVLFCSVNSLT